MTAAFGLPAVFVFVGLLYLFMGVGAAKMFGAGSEPQEPRIQGEVPEA